MRSLCKLLSVFALFASLSVFAVVKVGESVPELYWKTSDGQDVSLSAMKSGIQVLLYNAGWCGPCNAEFAELTPRVKEFDGEPVSFISLSIAGWTKTKPASQQFLNEWKARHQIPFLVAATKLQENMLFFSVVRIPNVVIVDNRENRGTLVYKAINPGVDAIFDQVRSLLQPPE